MRSRTLTGCWTCRTRRVKCDCSKPSCNKCSGLGVTCRGYNPCWVWVEPNSPDAGAVVGRSTVDCRLTWKGYQLLEGDLVDHLIEQIDNNQSNIIPKWMEGAQNPFAVFSAGLPSLTRPLSQPAMPDSPVEQSLFYHYTTHVAKIMMPYDHPCNPWVQQYPAVALGCRSSADHALYDALLAHSAYNLSELRGNDHKLLYEAASHYDKALKKLLRRIDSGDLTFATTFASVLTLVLVEVYSGSSSKWRQHLHGASKLVHAAESDVQGARAMKTSIQSMYIIHIVGQTSSHFGDDARKAFSGSEVTSNAPEFGFTIGASKEVLQRISQITELSHAIASGTPIENIMPDLRSISALLDDQEANHRDLETDEPMQYQRSAFTLATKIYFHRVILNTPPKSVQTLVATTLELVMNFCEKDSKNNFSIWPAFIAAVEAYTERDIEDAEKWLRWSTTFGMGNRILIANIVREVWRRREAQSQLVQVDQGLICIDWRVVMRELGHDVLLI